MKCKTVIKEDQYLSANGLCSSCANKSSSDQKKEEKLVRKLGLIMMAILLIDIIPMYYNIQYQYLWAFSMLIISFFVVLVISIAIFYLLFRKKN